VEFISGRLDSVELKAKPTWKGSGFYLAKGGDKQGQLQVLRRLVLYP